jgi:hypothetical protein
MIDTIEKCNFFDRINKKIELYDKNEKLARHEFPVYALRSFIPSTFSAFNFVTQMSTANDAWKYLDSQQEFRIGSYFERDMMGFITNDELALVKNIAMAYAKYTSQFERKTIPLGLNHMFSSIATLRALQCLQSNKTKPLKILEIGGGSSLLGQMCFKSGFEYSNFDITQAFAIHNSCVYSELYEDEFMNFAEIPNSLDKNLITQNSKKINFIPWWHFLNTSIDLPRQDIIVMNHCFFEISLKALYFILARLGYHGDRQSVFVSHWGIGRHMDYGVGETIEIEKKFLIKSENFVGSERTFGGDNNLFSYKFLPSNITEMIKFPQRRLGFEDMRSHQNLMSKIKMTIPITVKRLIKAAILSNKAQVLGVKKVPLNSPISLNKGKNNFDTVIQLIKDLEDYTGKPSITEDELFGYFIKSDRHA